MAYDINKQIRWPSVRPSGRPFGFTNLHHGRTAVRVGGKHVSAAAAGALIDVDAAKVHVNLQRSSTARHGTSTTVVTARRTD